MPKPASELGQLLRARVNAAHAAIGAPLEEMDDPADDALWTLFDLGYDGVLGIKSNPDPASDGDRLLVALPSNGSRLGSKRTVQIMKAWCASGRFLYTSAWVGHHLAVRINRSMGGQILGQDSDDFIHFKHTADSLPRSVDHSGVQGRGEKEYTEGT